MVASTDEDTYETSYYIGCFNNYGYYIGDYDLNSATLNEPGTYVYEGPDYEEISFATLLVGAAYENMKLYMCPLLSAAIFDKISEDLEGDSYLKQIKAYFTEGTQTTIYLRVQSSFDEEGSVTKMIDIAVETPNFYNGEYREVYVDGKETE
jgi:hypothetical protein